MWKRWLAMLLAVLGLLLLGYLQYLQRVVNPRVVEQIRSAPQSAVAARVMILTLPDGAEIPVNYLREGNQVFAGADGRWWRAFNNELTPVTLVIKGKTHYGQARVELADQNYVNDVFSRLRPSVPTWLPDWANGKLVIVNLQ